MSAHEAPPGRTSGDGPVHLPLTWSQQLLWMGQRLFPASPLYNMVLAFHIRGPLDATRFEVAWRSVVNRADALRTTLTGSEQPQGRIQPPPAHRVDVIDLSGTPDPHAAADAWMQARGGTPLDTSTQLFDCALLRLGEREWIWYLTQHHLITDAWSTALVFTAVSDTYVALGTASDADLPPLPSYAGFIQYLDTFADSPQAARARTHWREVRARGVSPMPLYGKKHAASPHTRTERVTVPLGADRSARIVALAGSPAARGLTAHASAFNVFAALIAGFVARVSGQDDVAIGTLSHNRPTAALKATIGVFVELFPLQVSVDAGQSFTQLLATASAASHALLRSALPTTSDAALNRALNVVLNYMTAAFPDFAGLPTQVQLRHSGHGDAAHDLRVQVHDFSGGSAFTLEIDVPVDRFDTAERARLATHLLAFIDAVLAAPEAPLASHQLLAADEARWLREDVSGLRAAHHSAMAPASVLASIRAGVERHPERDAVVSGDIVWSYRQLARRALTITDALERIGTRGRPVAIALRRSADAVAAMLGVLEAGSAYVILDPASPAERTARILQQAAVAAVLVDTDGSVPAGTPVVDLRRLPLTGDSTEGTLEARPLPDASALAYVLFTSGSTGTPKGVMIGHGALSHYAHWAAAEYLPHDRVGRFALCTALTFDLTVTSVFAPLVAGHTVVVYPDRGEAIDMGVLEAFDDDSVDVVKLTPSHLALLSARRPARIRTVIVGGEDLRRDVARAAHTMLGGDGRVVNEYGPTEITVACTLHDVDPATGGTGSEPIGRPIPGATIAIVDEHGQLVPTGVVGEITVGGVGVAQGYLGDAVLTGTRFVDDPLRPGRRAYRTGDAGRWRSDGTLEFLGRRDRQVKVHGVRIEPAEIEAVLAAHPAVTGCVVVAHEASIARPVDAVRRCTRCGIPSDHPDVLMGPDDLCSLCSAFEGYRTRATEYFGQLDELTSLLRQRATTYPGSYDCLMLLSGGKDSTYALSRLVEQGFRVLAVTLDNGYISEGAKENVRRVTAHLGVPHEFMTSPVMDRIFVDSLERFSNVCQGCFKTLYTLAFNIALERGIPSIVTGLSRGQFFETRLTEELFFGPPTTRKGLELVVLDARKAYHRANDVVNSLLDTRAFADDAAFERVEFIDFYRFCDVDLDDMLRYLDQVVPWIRPEDTGRSTNCLINDVGIHVHKLERGYHNYALPYSWDVRLGHKQRDAALAELDDQIDEQRVAAILSTIGYTPKPAARAAGAQLTAFVTGDPGTTASQLRAFLAERLPAYMIPAKFVHVDTIPLTARGKVDVAALAGLSSAATALAPRRSTPPSTPTERVLCRLWASALQLPGCGIDDNFFDAGGDSITAIRVAARATAEGLPLTPNDLFRHQTVRALAPVIDASLAARANPGAVAQPRTPDASTTLTADTRARIAQLLAKADRATGESGGRA